MKILSTILCIIFLACCSITLPKTKISLRVVDEVGRPVADVKTGIAFEVLGGSNRRVYNKLSPANGVCTYESRSTGSTAYSAEKDGYYPVWSGYHFYKELNGKWQPWNPEVKIIMRKIINPVPMYARSTNMSSMKLPTREKKVGFDLIEYDWVPPYGKGKYSDLIFYSNSASKSSTKLFISFASPQDGIQKINNEYGYGVFKFPRNAFKTGYKQKIVLDTDGDLWDTNIGYVFRIRSSLDGKTTDGMYGKIVGGISYHVDDSGAMYISMHYYVNPDHTTNLEFDPKRNLFKDVHSYELLTAP